MRESELRIAMPFLALETTGSLPVVGAVLTAVAVAGLLVRRMFGYSFATWRFHLRGETIRSAHDIGWLRELTDGRMMRRDVRTVRDDTKLSSFRRDFPLGSTERVVALDQAGRYAGLVTWSRRTRRRRRSTLSPRCCGRRIAPCCSR
ncbi:hypothetical protein [Neoroseomonas lacus]|uniref:Uncharacterized protein n=1 Tax=Neoroseomonas lacus TaxID=287609 RepID=A0A917KCN5_9PROT|nr:hypothetical protein [Neoroseomonas lacus]GGJ08388.1 hypothetical protein GCM10011320_14230 [Neoroseomonas lacus]